LLNQSNAFFRPFIVCATKWKVISINHLSYCAASHILAAAF
jgi:hypothetical protein